jgi:hypothetical protein
VLFSNLCLPKSSNSSLLFSFAQIGLLQTLNVQLEVVEWDAPCFMLTNIAPSLQMRGPLAITYDFYCLYILAP